ncbi:penicillin-binding protein 1A [Acetitomaculum ruminis DSM 5522]|uniref:Penicillin-binding protein 1A n=1 Tax=Acetitomaculum ruminis DSM 5522 TaxID=1120918 RepID=A0A1I0XCN4_9FIRM|nr:PBP1A family penicillin-binding protein [Acetitomaculum ruminis]SFA98186.1 penicillin-binding protein 1A [Acetitomaculum ruminis DSM 5522]
MKYTKSEVLKKNRTLFSKRTRRLKTVKLILLRLFILLIFAGIGGGGYLVYQTFTEIIASAPKISDEDVSPSGLATSVYSNDGTEITKLVASGSNRQYKKISEIPEDLQHAFVAIEDERFYEHNGIDVKGIFRAALVILATGHPSQGASTITQQLIKNNIFSDWTSESTLKQKITRKVQEQYLALQLEKSISKDKILEYYLNTINLGSNCLGVQTAAQYYFNKNVEDLTISESAVIAAITQNPTYNNPVNYPENNKKRKDIILDHMLKQGYINQEQYNEAMADDIYTRITQTASEKSSNSRVYSYFVDELIDQVASALEVEKGYSESQAYNAIYKGGLSIYTTQDLSIQAICDNVAADPANFPAGSEVSLTYNISSVNAKKEVVNTYSETDLLAYFQQSNPNYSLLFNNQDAAMAAIAEYKAYLTGIGENLDDDTEYYILTPQPQTSVVVMDQHTGEVKAIVGGRGTKSGSLTLNRATNTTRQPGSTFKILSTYAPAIDKGFVTLATSIKDEPFNYSNGRPVKNWYSGYRGRVTVRTAIRDSMNIIAVKTLTDITPQLGYDYLLDFGFTTLVDNMTLADGSVVSDIGQPLALGGITNGITNLEITAAYACIANNGKYIKPSFFTKIVDSDGNVIIDNSPEEKQVLKETTAYILTQGMESVINEGTGTTAKFAGMPIAGKTGTTTDSVDLWLCAYTPYYTCSVWGGYDDNTTLKNQTYHMVIWNKIMQQLHSGLENKDFDRPEGIVTAAVCKSSGLLAGKGCESITEYFSQGSVPSSYCTTHTVTEPENEEDNPEDNPDGQTNASSDNPDNANPDNTDQNNQEGEAGENNDNPSGEDNNNPPA